MEKRIIQVEEKVPLKRLIPLSIQHMFAMFGASVLVPFLFGISPAIVLFMNGIGTLLFIVITKGKAPAYLGSSFAFLAPASIVIQNFGYEYALGGFVAVGFCGCILALIILPVILVIISEHIGHQVVTSKIVGKLSALISTIPGPVIGGISFLLYGMIGTSGLRILVDSKVDYSKNRNQMLTSVIFVTGLSGAALRIGDIELTGMVLACVVGMAMSLVFYVLDRFKLTNDQAE